MELLIKISESLQEGDSQTVVELVNEAISQKIDPQVILKDGLMAGMNVVGEKFKNEEIFVPEVLISARAMNKGVAVLKSLLAGDLIESIGTAVIGTVKGDLHDIGKNLVRIMMEGKGIKVVDLGTDVAAETFIAKAKEEKAQLICCSSLLTTTMPEMQRVVELVKKENLPCKVMVGGAPVNQEFADEIKADAYTDDATSAAIKAKELLGK